MAFSGIITTVKGAAGNPTTVTTDAIDTTGKDLIVISASWYNVNDADITISDSKGNTWTALTKRVSGITTGQLFYCVSPTVGAGHTFTATSSQTPYPGIGVVGATGVHASPFDLQAGSTGTGTSLAAGPITPSVSNCLVVAGMSTASGTSITIDGGFTASTVNYSAGQTFGVGIAHLIQTSAVAAGPAWSWTTAGDSAASIASFKPAAGGGASPVLIMLQSQGLFVGSPS